MTRRRGGKSQWATVPVGLDVAGGEEEDAGGFERDPNEHSFSYNSLFVFDWMRVGLQSSFRVSRKPMEREVFRKSVKPIPIGFSSFHENQLVFYQNFNP
jgi:hypothetical protein